MRPGVRPHLLLLVAYLAAFYLVALAVALTLWPLSPVLALAGVAVVAVWWLIVAFKA